MIVGYLPTFATRSLALPGFQAFAPSVIALTACLLAVVSLPAVLSLTETAGRPLRST